MVAAVSVHERARLASFFGQNPALHLYALGDLDEFFWPRTTWYGLEDDGLLREAVLLYDDGNVPVLQAITTNASAMRLLLRLLLPLLPPRLHLHLSPGVLPALASDYCLQSQGTHWKMVLPPSADRKIPAAPEAVRLTSADAVRVMALYDDSYPGHWFQPRMLETEQYFGIYHKGTLASAAGVHVYSAQYNAAALGNVVTRPGLRGLGLATQACAALCRSLAEQPGMTIGLNVQCDNFAAIACYQKLGFVQFAEYEELTAQWRPA